MKKGYDIALGVAIGVVVTCLVFTKWYEDMAHDQDKPLLNKINDGDGAQIDCTMSSSISWQNSGLENNEKGHIEAGYEAMISGDRSKLLDFLFLLRTHPSPTEFLVYKLLNANYSEQRILLDALSLEDEGLRLTVLNSLFREGTSQAVDLALDIVKNHHFSYTSLEVEALLIEQSYHMEKPTHIADIARLLNLRSAQAHKKEEIAQRMETLLLYQNPDIQVQAIAGITLYGSQLSLVSAIEKLLSQPDLALRRAAIQAMYSVEPSWLHSNLIHEVEHIAANSSQENSLQKLAEDILDFHGL